MTYCPFRSFNASWDQANGLLVAPIAFDIAEFEEYSLSFVLANGNQTQESPDVRVAFTSVGAEIPPRDVEKDANNRAVLLIAGWNTLSVSQSSANAGSPNVVSLNISTTGMLVAGTNISITGLTGPVNPAGWLPLTSTSSMGVFSPHAQWFPVAGILLLTVIQDTLPMHMYQAAIEFNNPLDGQRSQTITAEAIGPLNIAQTDIQGGPGNGGPLGVAGIIYSSIEQSTASSNRPNTIHVQFSSYVPLTVDDESLLVISGLTGSATPSGNLSVSSDGTTDFGSDFANVGEWNATAGSLTLRVVRDTLDSTPYSFTFILQNPVEGHDASSAQIQSLGVRSRTQSMMSGTGNAAPLLVADFQVSAIGQATPSQLAVNTITVTLSTRASLLREGSVSITGLDGSDRASTNALDVSILSAPTSAAFEDFSSTAVWDRENGVLVLPVANGTVPGGTYVITFELQNAAAGRSPSRGVFISSAQPYIPPTAMVVPAGSNNEPLLVAHFTSLHVIQPQAAATSQVDTDGVYQPSNISITLTFATSASLLTGSNVVLQNLTHSLTPSTTKLPIVCSPNHLSSTATWSQADGRLSLSVAVDTQADHLYQCEFSLLGPARGQDPPTLSVYTDGIIITPREPTNDGPETRPLGVYVLCNPLEKPLNGMVISQDPKQEAVVVCSQGFQLLGSRSAFATSYCGTNGQWAPRPSCVKVRGTLFGWGSNIFSALGDVAALGSELSIPVPVHNLTAVTIAVGSEKSSAAMLSDGTVVAWGDNTVGQIGDGSTSAVPAVQPRAVVLAQPAVALGMGSRHGLAILTDGSVLCWGDGQQGQLGQGVFSSSPLPVLAALPGTRTAAAIAAGDQHSLAITSDNTQVYAWGNNQNGQVGLGAASVYSSPQLVSGVGSASVLVVSIAAGRAHSLALLARFHLLRFPRPLALAACLSSSVLSRRRACAVSACSRSTRPLT